MSVVSEHIDSKREGDTRTRCSTYLHAPDETHMNNHQALYLVSIYSIFAFILASSVLCGGGKLQSNIDWHVTAIQFV